jgi:dienelactone hydrolase
LIKTALVAFGLTCSLVYGARIPEQDARNVDMPSGRTHFTMPDFDSRESWLDRAAFLKKQILAGSGLLPMPAKTPLNAQVFGKLERDGYTVEKVLIETYPGYYLGGNLYRPRGKSGPFPGVVSPHGHWAYGRLENTPLVSVPARCINLARQGFVVFTYDMVGYNDTDQIPHGDRGPQMGGPREDLWNINTMGLQLWNSIRSVDFVSSLPDVDPERIGVTGASGGGTQTFYLMAVEDRIKAAAPVNMVSFVSQGGGCQQAANIRVDANNVVFTAMMAPRPLLMVSAAGDWTRNTPQEEFPAVRNIYRMLDAESNVENVHVNQLHNYNQESREAVYEFFNEKLNGAGPAQERSFRAEQVQDLLALFGRERPANSATMEQFVAARIAEARQGIEKLQPRDRATLDQARQAFNERLQFSMLVSKPAFEELLTEKTGALAQGETLLLGRTGKGDRIPAVLLSPARANSAVPPTLIVHPEGASWVVASSQRAGSLVKGLLDRGGAVLGIDAFQTGTAKAPRELNERGFTVYNRTDDANRIQDILTALAYLQGRQKAQTVNLVGLEMGGVWSYFARAMAGEGVTLAADLSQFQTDRDEEYLDKFYIPGLRKAGDFRAAATLNTRGKGLLHNTGAGFPTEWARSSSQAAGDTLDIREARASESEILAWLASEPRARTGR